MISYEMLHPMQLRRVAEGDPGELARISEGLQGLANIKVDFFPFVAAAAAYEEAV
jgi:hypothetical protein